MEAVKLGLQNIVINIPAKYFQTPTDGVAIVDFHNMHWLLQRKDLDVSQVTIFAF